MQLADLEPAKMFTLKGIGDSLGKKITEIISHGRLPALEEIMLKTPPGVTRTALYKRTRTKKNRGHLERHGNRITR